MVASGRKVVDFRCLGLAVPIRLQKETTCTRDILSTQQKNCQLRNEFVSVDYTSRVGEKQFSNVRKSRKFRDSNIKACCSWLRNRLVHHTLQLRVYMYKVCHRTQYNCRCLEDEERNCKWDSLFSQRFKWRLHHY